jgi:hypothetical protein
VAEGTEALRTGRLLDEVLFTDLSLDEEAGRVHAVTDQERLRDELVAEYAPDSTSAGSADTVEKPDC